MGYGLAAFVELGKLLKRRKHVARNFFTCRVEVGVLMIRLLAREGFNGYQRGLDRVIFGEPGNDRPINDAQPPATHQCKSKQIPTAIDYSVPGLAVCMGGVGPES